MRHLRGFAPLAGEFRGFIVDLWGVVHDGVRAYPGAVVCLEQIQREGGKVVLLSNAPRRAAATQAAMRKMGIDDALYCGIMTSGEATHIMLRDRTDPWFAALGSRAFHLGPERDRNVLDGLPYARVVRPADADFVLNTGPDDHANPSHIEDYEPLLEACAVQNLPMVCVNPDREVIRGGHRVLCAGALAVRYRELGGEVRMVGKPDPAIYCPVIAMLELPRERILAVGDGLQTDIAGARAAGLAAAWVLGGIHGERLRGDVGAAEQAAAAAGLSPIASLPAFVWA